MVAAEAALLVVMAIIIQNVYRFFLINVISIAGCGFHKNEKADDIAQICGGFKLGSSHH